MLPPAPYDWPIALHNLRVFIAAFGEKVVWETFPLSDLLHCPNLILQLITFKPNSLSLKHHRCGHQRSQWFPLASANCDYYTAGFMRFHFKKIYRAALQPLPHKRPQTCGQWHFSETGTTLGIHDANSCGCRLPS